MGKCYGVELGWTSADRDTLVESNSARSKFVAYQAFEEVPDEDVDKVDRAVKPVAKPKMQARPADKARRPGSKGLHIDEGEA